MPWFSAGFPRSASNKFVITSEIQILKVLFQKHSADSKRSIDIYSISVAAVFQKLWVKVDATLVFIEIKLHGSTYCAVRRRLYSDVEM